MGLQLRREPSRKVKIITTLMAVFALVAQPLYGLAVMNSVYAETANTVHSTDLAGWSLDESRSAGHSELVSGGLHVWTTASDSNNYYSKAAGYHAADFNLADAGTASIEFSTFSGVRPSLQLGVDKDGNGSWDGYLVYEPWAYGDGKWWSSKDFGIASGAGYMSFGTLSDYANANPAAKVTSVGYSLGSGVVGDAVITKLSAGGTDYTFSTPPADTTGPSMSDITPVNNAHIAGTTRFSANVTDVSGVKKIAMYLRNQSGSNNEYALQKDAATDKWYKDVNTNNLAGDGTYNVVLRAVDNKNNVTYFNNRQDSFSVVVDNTGPLAPALVSPANNAKVKGSSVTQSWTNGGSIDVDHYVYESYHDAGLTNLRWRENINGTSKTATNVAEATYWWRVKAVDHVGNSSDWSEVRKLTIDNTKPTASLDFPGTIPGATSFKVKFNEDVKKLEAGNPANYFLHNWPGTSSFESLAGHATVDYDEATTTATVTFTDPNWYVSGEQNWGVRNIHDIAGNQMVETSAYSSPLNGPLMTSVTFNEDHNDVTWNWTADDGASGSGVKNYMYKLVKDDSTIENWTSTSSKTYFKHLDDGTYTFSVKAWDNAGNEGNVLNLTFTLDSVAPVLTMGTPVLNEDGTYTVKATTNDPTSDVEFYLDGNLLSGATSNDSRTVWTAVTPPLSPQTTHTVTAKSTDGAQNEAEPASKTFTVPVVNSTPLSVNVPGQLAANTPDFASAFTQQPTPQQQPQADDTEVLGAQTLKDSTGSDMASIAATPEGWKIFGIAWYWILLALVAVGSAAWAIVAASRRRAAQDV